MKKTDLRIGNLAGIKETALHADGCNHSEAVFEIEEIKKDVVQFKGYHANEYYKDLNPIPLTEQWLLDFGLVKKHVDFRTQSNPTAYNGGILELNDFTVYLDKSEIEWSYRATVLDAPKYVHQLQNLYFALTQEELILKERSKE